MITDSISLMCIMRTNPLALLSLVAVGGLSWSVVATGVREGSSASVWPGQARPEQGRSRGRVP